MEEDERGLTAPLSVRKSGFGSRGHYPVSRRVKRCLPAEVAGHLEGVLSMREIITLQCPECKNRNYSTTKNKKTTTGRLEFSKFCNTCRKHTDHKETK
jgi:large subunit ribosomal protein L33